MSCLVGNPDGCFLHAKSQMQELKDLINTTKCLPVLSVPSDNGFGLVLGSDGFGDDQSDAGDGVVVGNVGGRQWT